MLLSPVLRKIMTAALVLPAGVIATSSYADCSSSAREIRLAGSEWTAVADTERSKAASYASHAAASDSGKRLSRQAFYGDEAPAAVIDISAER